MHRRQAQVFYIKISFSMTYRVQNSRSANQELVGKMRDFSMGNGPQGCSFKIFKLDQAQLSQKNDSMLRDSKFGISGFARTRRRVGHRVRHQVHGDLCQSIHQCRGVLLHTRPRHQSKNGKENCKFYNSWQLLFGEIDSAG